MTDIINDEVQLGLNYEIGHAPYPFLSVSSEIYGHTARDFPHCAT